MSFFMSEKAWKVGLNHFEWRKKMRKFGLSFFMSEKVRKFELCNFLCRKKCGKLDFIIIIGKKSSESWPLSLLLVVKARKVELDHF